jgi:hypothetical protein
MFDMVGAVNKVVENLNDNIVNWVFLVVVVLALVSVFILTYHWKNYSVRTGERIFMKLAFYVLVGFLIVTLFGWKAVLTA